MREIRIYQLGTFQPGQVVELSVDAARHIALVLRMREGDTITLFNGEDFEFKTTIYALNKKSVSVLINEAHKVCRESPLAIHLAQGISKGDRMEWAIQKAVELGVASITPIISERCAVKLNKERLLKKVQQWQAIVIAACEQCGRNRVPHVHKPTHFDEYLMNTSFALKFIAHPGLEKSWRNYSFKAQEVSLLIGPEGGFSQAEVDLALKQQFAPLSLGPRILRTETATISALSVLQAVGGDL